MEILSIYDQIKIFNLKLGIIATSKEFYPKVRVKLIFLPLPKSVCKEKPI